MKIYYLICSIHLFNNNLYSYNSTEVKVNKQGDAYIRKKSIKLLEPKKHYSVCAEFHTECLVQSIVLFKYNNTVDP